MEESNKPLQKYWWIIAIGAGILIIAGIFLATFIGGVRKDDNKTGKNPQTLGSFAQSYSDTCKERDVAFTSPPLRMEDLGYIRPLGAMSDGHVTPTDHVYVGPVNTQVADNTYPVLMPADGTVVEVSRMPDQYIGDRSGQQLPAEDHRMVISFSCRYYAIYIHIHKLADTLKRQLGELKPNESKRISVELKAGDTVGFIGGQTFDWTPVDTNVTLSGFISPKLYEQEPWKIHTVSPFDLYTGVLRTQLEAKSLRSVSPIGGKIDYDQRGKLIGSWFRSGTNGYAGNTANGEGRYWDGHLSVVPDYIDPSYTVVSIGNWQDKAAQFTVKGKLDPSSVSSSNGMVKVELTPLAHTSDSSPQWNGNSFAKNIHPRIDGPVSGTIAFEVLPDEKLKVEKFIGKRADTISGFTAAAQIYER